jgi:DNA-binding FadR family transcriptional regulator
MPKNLSEQLLHDLGKDIVLGIIPPGDVLPKVETLSVEKGVSRTVIREALKGLSARRLLESSTKTGTIVRPKEEWLWWDPDVISWASEAEDNRPFLKQLTEVRLAVEPAAVKLAAKYAEENDKQEMKEAFRVLEQATDDQKAWTEADAAFHNAMLKASHNQLMISLVQTLHNGLMQSRETTIRILKEHQDEHGDTTTKEALKLHEDVLKAILEGSEEKAETAMTKLLQSVADLIDAMNSGRVL